MHSRIARAELWHVPLPMPHAVHLGPITYTTRDYVVLQLTTSDGVTGKAIGYSRNTPLIAALRTLLAHTVGAAVGEPSTMTNHLKQLFAPGWGSMVRAASLIDIALWDIAARHRGVSLPSLFGKAPDQVSLMAVAGYYLKQRGPAAVTDEVRQFVDDGYTTIKLFVPGQDLTADLALVEQVAAVLPESVTLAIDVHGVFSDVGSASRYCAAFEGSGLQFIEDPFPSYEEDSIIELVSGISTPIASGEDLMSTSSYRQLLGGGVGVLRVDVTATGGYTAGFEGTAAAGGVGAKVIPHVWPHLHIPLTHQSDTVSTIEVIPHRVGADPINVILSEPFPIARGTWNTPTQPGLYLPLDRSLVERFADGHWAVTESQ